MKEDLAETGGLLVNNAAEIATTHEAISASIGPSARNDAAEINAAHQAVSVKAVGCQRPPPPLAQTSALLETLQPASKLLSC